MTFLIMKDRSWGWGVGWGGGSDSSQGDTESVCME
jgi:hypothetical protein